jgi:hypothetical protein
MKSFDLSKILNKITFWIDKSEIKTWTWHYWLFYYMIIPAFVLSIPLIIQYVGSFAGPQIPPYDIVNQTFVLNIYHPTIISMFLANYTHLEVMHLCSNLLYYLVFVSIIFFLEKSKEDLVKTSAFIFIFLPFFISLISIFYLGSVNAKNPTGMGFSGIVFAFLGYSMFLICKGLCENNINIEQKVWDNYSSDKKRQYFGSLLNYNLFILFCIPIMAISAGTFFFSGVSLVNGLAHFTGFLCGLLIPIVFLIRKNGQVKYFEMTLLIQIIVTMGIYGMYLIKIRQ